MALPQVATSKLAQLSTNSNVVAEAATGAAVCLQTLQEVQREYIAGQITIAKNHVANCITAVKESLDTMGKDAKAIYDSVIGVAEDYVIGRLALSQTYAQDVGVTPPPMPAPQLAAVVQPVATTPTVQTGQGPINPPADLLQALRQLPDMTGQTQPADSQSSPVNYEDTTCFYSDAIISVYFTAVTAPVLLGVSVNMPSESPPTVPYILAGTFRYADAYAVISAWIASNGVLPSQHYYIPPLCDTPTPTPTPVVPTPIPTPVPTPPTTAPPTGGGIPSPMPVPAAPAAQCCPPEQITVPAPIVNVNIPPEDVHVKDRFISSEQAWLASDASQKFRDDLAAYLGQEYADAVDADTQQDAVGLLWTNIISAPDIANASPSSSS